MEKQNPLKAWLRANGLRGEWLAKQIGVDPATLSQWATGRRVPLPHNRDAIERATGGGVPAGVWQP